MMNSFGYRTSSTMIAEGSGNASVFQSRIAKPCSAASRSTFASQEQAAKSFRYDCVKSEISNSARIVDDDVNRDNGINEKNVPSMRRRELDYQRAADETNKLSTEFANDNVSTNHSLYVRDIKASGEQKAGKNQAAVSKIARIDNRSLDGHSSNNACGKTAPKTGAKADDKRSVKSGDCENGPLSGSRKPLQCSLPGDVEGSFKPPGNSLEILAKGINSKKPMQSVSPDKGLQTVSKANKCLAKESPEYESNPNGPVRVSNAAKKPLQSKSFGYGLSAVKSQEVYEENNKERVALKKPLQGSISSKGVARSHENLNENITNYANSKKPMQSNIPSMGISVAKSQENSNEANTSFTDSKKPMQSSIRGKNIIKGIHLSNKSDCSDVKLTDKASEHTDMKGSNLKISGILKPKDGLAKPKTSSQGKIKAGTDLSNRENSGTVVTSKSGATGPKIAEKSNSSVPRKTEYFKYNEREEIKPRASADANKGRVTKATAQKARPKIVKEGVVAKRKGQGSKPVDCNLQKKQFHESKTRAANFQETKAEVSTDVSGAVVGSVQAGKSLHRDKDNGEGCIESCLDSGSCKDAGTDERVSFKGDVCKKRVHFNESNLQRDAKERNIGRDRRSRDRGEKDANDEEIGRQKGNVIGDVFEYEAGVVDNGMTFDGKLKSRSQQSLTENRTEKNRAFLMESKKRETTEELERDRGDHKKHVAEMVAKQHGRHCNDENSSMKPLRTAHVLIDEIVYKNKNFLCQPQGVLQTFSDQDLRAAVEEGKALCQPSYSSGSLDRNELRNRSKLKVRQNEYSSGVLQSRQNEFGDKLLMKSLSDPKITNENQSQGLASFSAEQLMDKGDKLFGGNSIQRIPITGPILREPGRLMKTQAFGSKNDSANDSCKKEISNNPLNLQNHATTVARTSSHCMAEDLKMAAEQARKVPDAAQRLDDSGGVMGSYGGMNGNTVIVKALISGASKRENKDVAGMSDKTVKDRTGSEDRWKWGQGPRGHLLKENGERNTGLNLRKDGVFPLQPKDHVSNRKLSDPDNVKLEPISEEVPKESVPRSTIPPTPPKRTVTNTQKDQLKCFSSNANNSTVGQYNSLANMPANGMSGNPAYYSSISQSNGALDYSNFNCISTNNEGSFGSGVHAASRQHGNWAELRNCSKTNNADVTLGNSNLRNHSVFGGEGDMGQRNTVFGRPKMPPRDNKLNTCGVQMERQMSPILEDARAEKEERLPLRSSGKVGLANHNCGIDGSGKLTQVKETVRENTQHQERKTHSASTQRAPLQGFSTSNAHCVAVEGSSARKDAKTSKNHSEKPKQNNFIASLVRMLQEGRSDSKNASTEAINNYDKTVLVDMQDYDSSPVGLTDDIYFVDEEDPFYQFSLKQGLHDKYGRNLKMHDANSYQQNNATHPNTRKVHDVHDKPKKGSGHETQHGHAMRGSDAKHETISSRSSSQYSSNVICDVQSLVSKSTFTRSSPQGADGMRSVNEAKSSEMPIKSSSENLTVGDGSSESISQGDKMEIRLRPMTLPTNLRHDFITISGSKEKTEKSPQDRTRLSSFSSVNSFKSCAATDGGNSSAARDKMDLMEGDEKIYPNLSNSFRDDRSSEVRENVRKLAELNLLKNSLKVAQASAKSGKKSSSKRKAKKNNEFWWESGQRAIFYSDNGDVCVHGDFEVESLTKRAKSNAKRQKSDCLDSPEVGSQCNVKESCYEATVKRCKMEASSEAIVTCLNGDYYKSVVKEKKNENIGDQEDKAGFLGCNSTERNCEVFGFPRVGMNDGVKGSPKTKPSAKVKPYTVVDLSTMSALTPEEVDSCLKEVTEAENRSRDEMGHCSVDENETNRDEAPCSVVLPPKTSRDRSNTTAGVVKNEDGTKLSRNDDFHDFKALKIVSAEDYSEPGRSTTIELSSFRARSKTAPSIKDHSKKTTEDHISTPFNKQFSRDGDQTNIICISPTKRNVLGNEICGTALEAKTTYSQSQINMSQDFPPPPSEEELGEKENERVQTPDWPPVPDSADSIGTQSLKNVFLGTENSTKMTSSGESSSVMEDSHPNRNGKVCDPHRSLPPIPGDADPRSAIPDVPLAWVSRATPHGTGPFIPMCESHENVDDMMNSHFYDDIDQIRKVAQERAMMIKRLEEEEARVHCTDRAPGKMEARNSLGDMPDLIPSAVDCKAVEGGRSKEVGKDGCENCEESRHANGDTKVSHKSGTNISECQGREADNLNAIENLPATATEKKSKSKFTRLFRKLSAQKSVDLFESKATTPQLLRKEIFVSKRESDRTEVLATPATSRRLFSLSKHRPQRQRTASEAGAMKPTADYREIVESKRSKNRTVSFGFGRKKAKKEARALCEDDQSIKSLEILKINSDVSSDSGSSTRLSPMTSPLMFDKDTRSTKYRAPEPPRSRHMSDEGFSSLRSDRSGSDKSSEHVSSNDNLAKDRKFAETLVGKREEFGEKLPKHYDKINEKFLCESTVVSYVAKGNGNFDEKRRTEAVVMHPEASKKLAKGESHDDVFVSEGPYDNYPPSKNQNDRPAKPPRSESEDRDPSEKTGKKAPEKPRRRSREHGLPNKPEPYSSQRSHRKITDQQSGTDPRLSPLSSNSEDEASSTKRYRVPLDYVGGPDGNREYVQDNGEYSSSYWESKSMKSSASDYSLTGHFRRGNMLYHSDRSMERSTQFRRRGSFSSEVIGDCYYENLRGTSDERENFLESYDKLLEIHQDTVRQISEATVFKCDCKQLQGTDWNDFEIRGKMLNYGISSYVTVPVSVKRGGKRMEEKYTAWLRQSFGFLQNSDADDVDFSICDVTKHENLLHICQDIRRSGSDDEENSDEVPRDIHVKRMLVSKVTPKMVLTKYLALTMDKHARDPESYEKEACLIILQILKGLSHLAQHGLMVDNIESESVLLSDIHRGVLSPNFNNNNNNNEVLGCPIAMYLALPGLLKRNDEVKGQDGGSNLGSKVEGDAGKVSEIEERPDDSGERLDKTEDSSGKCSDDSGVSFEKAAKKLDKENSKELISLIFDIFHASHLLDDGLEEGSKSIVEVPKLPLKSVYSDRMQKVIDKLFDKESISLEELVKDMQVISFCPLFMDNFDREELLVLLNKWRNKRCVDMVTDILKKYSLISLASGLAMGGTNSMGLARNCVLECQFLSNVTAQDIVGIMCGGES